MQHCSGSSAEEAHVCALYTVLFVCSSDGFSLKYTGMKSFCSDLSKLDPGVSVVKRGKCVHIW